ncbi:hypothetical protein [Neosynechococcus sphagnicola]|uniref:hypothetical protein n=1 Tax=Neosynechococcus sphagnicola TaxID=1501145 RepID=UPI000AE4F511
MSDTKPRDVQVATIAADTMMLRSRTWERLKFEIEYSLQRGTTSNSYLIQSEKTALFDPPGESFTAIYLEELQQHLNWQKLDYILLGHVNPNRMVTLKTLLEWAPHVTLVCSRPGAITLKAALPEHESKIWGVRSEETLDLGKGHELQFLPTPPPGGPMPSVSTIRRLEFYLPTNCSVPMSAAMPLWMSSGSSLMKTAAFTLIVSTRLRCAVLRPPWINLPP